MKKSYDKSKFSFQNQDLTTPKNNIFKDGFLGSQSLVKNPSTQPMGNELRINIKRTKTFKDNRLQHTDRKHKEEQTKYNYDWNYMRELNSSIVNRHKTVKQPANLRSQVVPPINTAANNDSEKGSLTTPSRALDKGNFEFPPQDVKLCKQIKSYDMMEPTDEQEQ